MSTAEGLLLVSMLGIIFPCAWYVYVLYLLRRPLTPLKTDSSSLKNFPDVYLIVPVFNEEELIAKKIFDCARQKYPKLHILFVDGGSSDNSHRIFLEHSPKVHVPCKWLRAPSAQKGKIKQLNFAFSQIPPESYCVISDCDAFINETDAIHNAVLFLETNPSYGLLGGWVRPPQEKRNKVEDAYWDKQNRMRYLECLAHSTSIVVAPFYVFKSDLIKGFPNDCLADDVFISFLCHKLNKKVYFSPEINIVEVRHPQTWTSMFSHKLRKANAYTIELVRSFPWFRSFHPFAQLVYAVKISQFLILPWSLLIFALSLAFVAFSGQFIISVLSVTALVGSILFASYLMKAPGAKIRGGLSWEALYLSVISFFTVMFVLFVNFFIYPFWTQNPSYKKVAYTKKLESIDKWYQS